MRRGTNQNLKITIIGTLIVALTAIAVGYASFSESLTISGTASVEKSNWKVIFKNLSAAYLNGTATEITHPEIDTKGTKIGNYHVKLTAPGDFAGYIFSVANEGTFCSEVESVTIPTPSCTGTGDTATTDAANVCKRLSYTLTYSDGNPIKAGDKLQKGEEKELKLMLTYSSDVTAEELPKNDVTISNLSVTMQFRQSTSC